MKVVYKDQTSMVLEIAGGHEVTIDPEDYEKVSKYTWTVQKGKKLPHGANFLTCKAHIDRKDVLSTHFVQMHRFVLGITTQRVKVKHLNGNGLDNRKQNLKITKIKTKRTIKKWGKRHFKQTSVHRGVSMTANGRWQAEITINGKKTHLGTYKTPEEAKIAYDEAVYK